MARATLRDVAQKAGVSPSTVSRVFSKPDLVAFDARERVEAVARELKFVPNPIARGLAKKRTGNLGLIVPDIANPYFAPLVKSLQADARKRGLNLFVADSDEHSAREPGLASAMSLQVDGLVLASPRMADESVQLLSAEVPVVTLGRLVEGVSGVGTPAEDAIHQAVELLATQGHQKICYLDGPEESFAAAGRREAITSSAAQFGITVLKLGPFQPVISAGRRAADLVLASDATAAIAYNDPIAFGCVSRLKESGRRVPDHYSVVGIDDSPIAVYCDPQLTTVHIPVGRAGALGLEILLQLMGGPTAGQEPIVHSLPSDLVIRGSTAIRRP